MCVWIPIMFLPRNSCLKDFPLYHDQEIYELRASVASKFSVLSLKGTKV